MTKLSTILLILFAGFATVFAGNIVNVTEASIPAGIVDNTSQCDVDLEMTTVAAPMVSGNYRFCYWEEVLPSFSNRDDAGRAVNPYTFSPFEEMTVNAIYCDVNEDTDADGVPDWYEWHYYGDLSHTADSDTDADGFTLIEEYVRDFHPAVADIVIEGGVTISTSASFTYITDAVALKTIRSEPEGIFTTTSEYIYKNTTVVLDDKYGTSGNFRFTHWTINGVRQADQTGKALGGTSFTFTEDSACIAYYTDVNEDSDADGVPDWFELLYYGDLTQTADSDTDGDGFTLIEEYVRDSHPGTADIMLEGGVTISTSASFTYISHLVALNTVKSEPEGIFATTAEYLYKDTTVVLDDKYGAIGNYRFTHWTINGVRQADANGRAVGGTSFTFTEDTVCIAYYADINEDSDADGIPDWFELLHYGNLDQSADSDTDGDGFTLIEEYVRDSHPLLADIILEGGVTISTSASFEYDAQFYDKHRSIFVAGAGSPLFFSEDGTTAGAYSLATQTAPALGDWDGDGDLDLFVGASGNNFEIYENRGTPVTMNLVEHSDMPAKFASQPTGNIFPSLGDWSGDGNADLAISGNDGVIRIYLSDAIWDSAGYAAEDAVDTGTAASVYAAFADVDADSKKDLIVLLPDGTISAYLNTGSLDTPFSTATIQADIMGVPVDNPTGLTAADVDGDGDTDIIASTQNGRMWEFINNGDGSWWLRSKILTGSYDDFSLNLRITAGDVDGDGDIDYFAGYENGGLVYLRNPDAHLIVRPGVSTVMDGETIQFECLNAEAVITWSISENVSGGTIDPVTGLYTAGNTKGIDCISVTDGIIDGNAWANVVVSGGGENAGSAIVVAGRRTPNDSVWPSTSFLAENAYKSLLYRGFSSDDICYMTYNNTPSRDFLPASTNLEWALTDDNLVPYDETALVIYLVDHGRGIDGEDDGLFLMSNSDTLSGTQLDAMLDTFRVSHTQCDITIIADTCYSGDFIQPLYENAPAERLVISSTGIGELTHFISGGLVSFSKCFWSGISQGIDVTDAYTLAKNSMQRFQNAEIHDPGTLGDKPIGLESIVGSGRPLIGSKCDDIILTDTDTANLWVADVGSSTAISRVWAVVVPPTYSPNGDSPVTQLPEIEFTWNSGTMKWEAEYGGFAESGGGQSYIVMVFAEDLWGEVSLPSEILVDQNGRRDRVIISASGGQSNAAWHIIRNMGRFAYKVCGQRNIAPADIRFLCEDTNENGAYSVPSAAAMQESILTWSTSEGALDTLTIFMIGENDGNGMVCENNDVITPAMMKGWLDTLQAAGNCEVRLIVESSYSNAFLACADENYSRIIVTTAEGDSSLKMLVAQMCFVHHFWNSIKRGKSIKDAFDYVCKKLRKWKLDDDFSLDDDGDGVFNKKKDGYKAAKSYIGSAYVTGDDPTTIGSAPAFIAVQDGDSAFIWAKDITTASGEEPDSVWAEILPPGSENLPPASVAVSTVDLVWDAVAERYVAEFDGFGDAGIYHCFLYAGDPDLPETISTPVPVKIYYDTSMVGNATDTPQIIPIIPIDGSVINGTITHSSPGTLYRFLAEKGTQLTFELFGLPTRHDCSITILDGSLATVYHVDDWGEGFGETAWSWPVNESGWYYLRVAEFSGGASSYQLRGFIEYNTNPEDIYEIDDIIANAKYIKPASLQHHNFYAENDIDWVRFYAINGHSYNVETLNEVNGADTAIGVYNADGSTVVADVNANGSGGGEILNFTATASKLYFVKVLNAGSVNGRTIEYDLRITDTTAADAGYIYGNVTSIDEGIISGNVSCTGGFVVPIQNGQFVIPTGAGTFTLTVTATDYITQNAEVTVTADQASQKNFILYPTISEGTHFADTDAPFWQISQDEVNAFIADYANNSNTAGTGNGDITPGRITMRETLRVIYLYNGGGAYKGGQGGGTVDGYALDGAPGGDAGSAPPKIEQGNTITVAHSADSGVGSFRNAVFFAKDGDIITFDESLDQIILVNEILIDKSITIDGNGVTLVSGDSQTRIFRVYNENEDIFVIMLNMGIVDGKNSANKFGGAIYNNGEDLTLENCLLTGNRNTFAGGQGGAIYTSGTLSVINSVFTDNTAEEEDDVYSTNDDVVLE